MIDPEQSKALSNNTLLELVSLASVSIKELIAQLAKSQHDMEALVNERTFKN